MIHLTVYAVLRRCIWHDLFKRDAICFAIIIELSMDIFWSIVDAEKNDGDVKEFFNSSTVLNEDFECI